MRFLDGQPEYSLLKWTGFQIAFTQVLLVACRVQIVCRSHIKACKTCKAWIVLPPYIGLHEVYTPTCRAWKTWTNVPYLLHRGGRRFESYSAHTNAAIYRGVLFYKPTYGVVGDCLSRPGKNLLQRAATSFTILTQLSCQAALLQA